MITSEGARLGVQAAQNLARTGRCELGPGLTEAEFSRIERQYGFEFSDDHRALLAARLPLNGPVPEEPGVIHTYAGLGRTADGTPEGLRRALTGRTRGLIDVDREFNGRLHARRRRPEGRRRRRPPRLSGKRTAMVASLVIATCPPGAEPTGIPSCRCGSRHHLLRVRPGRLRRQ